MVSSRAPDRRDRPATPTFGLTNWCFLPKAALNERPSKIDHAAILLCRATRKLPRCNYSEDPYCTHGLRTVLFLAKEPHSYQAIEWLEWARLASDLDIQLHQAEGRLMKSPKVSLPMAAVQLDW